MDQFVRSGFVLQDGLVLSVFGDEYLSIIGVIDCVDDIRIEVYKHIPVVGYKGKEPLVQTESYSYNAVLGGVGNILRYDSPHGDIHNPYHHKHVYDVLNGDQDGETIRVDEEGWPTLGAMVLEVSDWYYDNWQTIQQRKTSPN